MLNLEYPPPPPLHLHGLAKHLSITRRSKPQPSSDIPRPLPGIGFLERPDWGIGARCSPKYSDPGSAIDAVV